MKTSTSCSCHSEPDLCSTGVLERPRYYPRQLLTPAEMTLEQQYFRDKLRRHNRLLHGWGVVCGAGVCLVPDDSTPPVAQPGTDQTPVLKPKPWKVRVTPGYILGPYGDEILIDSEQVLDLRSCGQTGATGASGEPVDSWCVPVYVQRDPGPLFVAVRYQEMQSRPVRVQPAGCGCDDTQCEYSRWRDGFEICALTLSECPASQMNPPNLGDGLFKGPLPGCPDCPADPWVILARVEIDAAGAIKAIDNCSCRRQVVSFAQAWWRCTGDSCAIESVEVKDGVRVEPGTTFTVAVKTRFLMVEKPRVLLGEGVDPIGQPRVTANLLEADFTVRPDAQPGPRNLSILDTATNQVVAAKANAVTVVPKQIAADKPTPPVSNETAQAEPSAKSRGKGKAGDKP